MGILKDIVHAAGVVKDDSELAASARRKIMRWTDSDRIRFVNGLPQKLGGWEPHSATTFNGLCRGLIGWQDANSVARIGIGTHKKLYAAESDTFLNLTPIRKTSSLTDPFSVTDGDATVTVADTAHGASVGDFVEVSGASAVGGITPDGNYEVATVPDADSFTIEHSSAATSTVSGGGGSVTVEYEIAVGRQSGAQGSGYGVGTYGSGTYGSARDTYIVLPPRTWSLDNWGQYLVACPRGGSIYQWQLSPSARAAVVSNAPTNNTGIFVTEDKILVALGAGGDKMRVEWCDRDGITTWTPSDQNTAGGRTLTGGSEILFGMRTRAGNLLFTDASVWSMIPLVGQDVFGFNQVAAGAAGIIGPRAAADVNGAAFWMGVGDFYQYDGVVRPIRNSKDIRRFVLDAVVTLQKDKCFCFVNTQFSEIWWLYATGTEIDRYVKVNWDDWSWDVGTLARTAGIDKQVFPYPIMAGTDGVLYAHETGVDDDEAAMNEYIVSSPFQIGEGGTNFDILAIIPDFKTLTGEGTLTLITREYPQKAAVETSAGTIDSTTESLHPVASGRQAAYKWATSATGTNWRLGVMRFEIQPAGTR